VELEERVILIQEQAVRELEYYNDACERKDRAGISYGKERLDAYIYSYAIMIDTNYDQAYEALCNVLAKKKGESQ